MVAAMTESELGAVGEKTYTVPLDERDSSTRWASCLVVESAVGKLFNVRSRGHSSRREQHDLGQPSGGE
jgi:hypothetical protein